MVNVCLLNNKRKEDIGKYSNEHVQVMNKLEKELTQRSRQFNN